MKKLVCILSLLMLSSLAFGQINIPPCTPVSGTPCTDYFGVPNWANSPLPAGTITGFTVIAGGSGYANPLVVITDVTGTNATATAVQTGGVITSITGTGSNYTMPQVTIVDVGALGSLTAPTCGALTQPACGSGAMATAIIGAPFTPGTGMLKFQDALPDLKTSIPKADTTTFPGSDFYIIGLVQYTTKMHASLPPTTLRGYCQLASTTATTCTPSYLGPVILAQKNRPVRVLFKNLLPTGAGGNLFIPVDTTYMGAGPPYAQNRATLHLHGGATPWISDGTPHQWTAPAGEAGPARGDSTQFVPDMWFDATGNVVPAGTAGAKNDPGAGAMTFFWTNQQGGRLMFYHDHALGLTRLNVYAGEAAGYLLYDPLEESELLSATVPGTIATNNVQTAPDLAHLIPLVIQDKTFVPSATELAAEDPTWIGTFGANPPAPTGSNGDLWFPHVYVPNQNPADNGGANAFGRWDYGAWTLPGNQTALLAATPQSAVDVPCTSSAFPNQAVRCPITPNPSGTPESFMDTPVINGKAYPVLHVAPEAYRFRILSAGNDRSWNLQLYIADPAAPTEVKMLPAIEPGVGSPLPACTAITAITNTSLFIGLATAILDANGDPINGTGLPLGCWPIFGTPSQAAGIPVQQTMWPADGRAGGVPDPTMAGPPFIEIGTEGGLLPAPVVIPSMPTGYEANTRSVTITNVSTHGLWLGPAERADAIVDFSKFAGKTLILYNDAPTPAPAVDSRLDYFTGDGDQSMIGGAPNTLPGYGPNTRTIMQIVVDQPATGQVPFKLSALQGVLPSIFAQTQPQIIVPEPTYPPASGGYSATPTYSLITDAILTWFPVGSTIPVTYFDERKTIQELFTLDYGRMNATLGVELPLTNFLTQTTIPLGYIDPPTEIIKQGDTQLWHITHNGVDTHFIHFHLFNVQVINRSAWDGTKRPPDQNELGWKDTVRMNPLEDILVALQPIQPVPPFPVVDSYRLMDTTMAAGSNCPAPTGTSSSPLPCSVFTNVDPVTNNPAQTPNAVQNFGWEYVWHCHILGHEENDMMRAIVFNVPPEAPSNLTVAAAVAPQTGLTLTWTDNSASETGFTLQRATDAAFTTAIDLPGPSIPCSSACPLSPDINGQGVTWGGTLTYNDAGATSPPYFYRVRAIKPLASYWSSGTVTSAWSNSASSAGPIAGVSPTALAFGTLPVLSVSPAQTVTLSNTGTAPFTFVTAVTAIAPAGPADFVESDTCGGSVAAKSSCTLSVTFTPSVGGPESASLSITTTDIANPNFTVSLTGAGGSSPLLTITATNATMKYGSTVPIINASYSPANPTLTTPPTCTTTATKTSPVGNYPTICTAAAGPYTITYVAGTVSVTPVPLTIWAPNLTLTYGTNPVITPAYTGFVAGDTAATLTVAPNSPPICTTTATGTSPVSPPTYSTSCSGAVDPNYTISYVTGSVTIIKAPLTVTAPSPSMTYGGPIPNLTPTYAGFVLGDTPASLATQPTCTTTATVTSPVSPPTYPVTCSGGVSPNYAFTYVTGALTVTPAPLTITANSTSKTYGQTVTFAGTEFTTSGLVNGNTVTSVTLTSAGAAATSAVSGSPYPIVPSAALGSGLANYTISYVNGLLTVNRAPLTVTANNATKVYGAALPAFTPTSVGLVSPDTLASIGVVCSTTATATSGVGTYPITCAGAPANYTVTYNPGTLTVTQAALTVTANNASRIWGFANPTFNATGLVLVPPDTLASIGVTCTSAATPTSAVGTYPITCAGTPANYTVTYVAGTLTVTNAVQLTPASLTFATQNVGTTSAFQTATLRNIGGLTMTFSIAITGDFLRGGNGGSCGTTLGAGATCTINVRFRPTASGTRTGTLTVTSALAGTGTVALSGTGNGALAAVSPTTTAAAPYSFGNVTRGQLGTPLTVTVTNNGTTSMTFANNGFALGGTNPGQFRLTTGGSCVNGGTLAALASCTFTVNFAPTAGTARNAKNATVTIRSNATNGNQFVYVLGTAQ